MEYSNLSSPLVIDTENSSVLISSSNSQKVEVNKPITILTIKDCSSLSLYINAPVQELTVINCNGTDINVEATVQRTSIENSERSELHFGQNEHFGPVQTANSKGTTVCLPEACNMIPANKDGKVFTALLSADAQTLEIS